MHPSPRSRPRGFTVVELLTVIAIIALLLGLLLPALAGARKTGRKTRELNDLRQVGFAWALYATNHNEYVLPGYLDEAVQARWQVRFDYPQGESIPGEIAAPWTWRLASLLDNSHETLHGYADEDDFELLDIAGTEEAEDIAFEPAFGYNAYYVGGWWREFSVAGQVIPRYEFYHNPTASYSCRGGNGTIENARVVARSMAEIRRSDELLIFCSSTAFDAPVSGYKLPHDQVPGSHLVVPPVLADEPQWSVASLGGSGVDPGVLDILTATSAPIGRHSGSAAILFADIHTDARKPGALTDAALPNAWIDVAPCVDFTHTPTP